MKKILVFRALLILTVSIFWCSLSLAQTTAFTYQGRLADGGSPASGTYDLQVRLMDAASGGNPVGSTLTFNDVTVTGGVFSISLDFGASAFPGANR